MTTTQSSTTTAKQARNATEKTAETVQRGTNQVTEKAGQVFGQELPTVDFAQGVQRYFEFVQKAVDINRDLARNWADAVTSLSDVVREQTEKAGQLVTEQTEKACDLTTQQAETVESATRDQADKVQQNEKTPARRVRQDTNGLVNGHNDEQNERLIDTK